MTISFPKASGLRTFLFALTAAVVTLPSTATADIVFGSKSDPTASFEDLEPAPPALGDRLAALLGPDARPVEAERSEGLAAAIGKSDKSTPVLVEPDYTYAFVDGLPAATGDAEWACLTEALYFEARGEDARGVFAVAEVILNRVDSGRFPSSICGVVNQGTGKKYQCQFSYTCDGLAEVVNERRAFDRMGKIARFMIDGAPRGLAGGAQYYHTKAVTPYWSDVFDRVATIGFHHFYHES